ncbi:MAG: hypothetical protein U9R54_07005 [Bacteroidota bacterium]|nr:hypothetical protein [Bacteroidota bacterium]
MKESYIDVEKEYKKRILKIWEEIPDNLINGFEYRKFPIAPKYVKKNSLLFIGINPSFRNGAEILKTEKPIGFYELNTSIENKDIQYFEKFKDIAAYCKTDWTHLDLFFIRESKQKLIDNLTFDNIPFLTKQLDISFEIIENAQPTLIIVPNALASEFFGKMKKRHYAFDKIWKGYELFFEDNECCNKKRTFDDSIGTYRIFIGGKSVPILFSSMLSGQRALDIGSYERLKWQAKFILSGK